ncbi:MAG: tRNA threonylcarbamoyladenosine dehydratase [Gracilibacteraceae bacterium]|jgi:tRNA A37 threonylcarbamoyladenosine dehydratase|nr:tRNA threonylcarbamoyladenosine dehydratase [Gracilibacteraceae bacterium]
MTAEKPDQFSRTALQFGRDNLARLREARVAVFGIGGVGGYCAEALSRSGIGTLALLDDDTVCVTNINRQIIATHATVGQYKTDLMRARILEINPNATVEARRLFYSPETAADVDLTRYDYIVDAMDTVTAKLELVCRAQAAGTPLISAMGAANKLDPTAFIVADIYATAVCPLARIMRRELRRRGVPALKVVYSREQPAPPPPTEESGCQAGCVCPPGGARHCLQRRQIPGSNAFVPPVAGLILAGEVVKDLIYGNRTPALAGN